MSKKLLSTTGIALAVALFLAVNIVSGTALRFLRVDLTENDLYTLSEGTKNILADLEEPITLRFYVSKDLIGELPQLVSYSKRVQELLEEYAAASSKLTVEVIEPDPYSEEEDRAVGFGLRSAQINTAGDRIFFGLAATNSVDDEQTIPFFDTRREEFLEYDITEIVHNLSLSKRPVVGVLSTLPLRGVTRDPRQRPQRWVILQQIEQVFDIRHLEPGAMAEVPEEIDVLMIVHPKSFSNATLFAIDQFVLGGGNVLAFVDGFCEADPEAARSQNPMMANRRSQFDTLLATWGLELEQSKLAGDLQSAMRVGLQGGAVDFPLYMMLRKERLAAADFVTGDLAVIAMRSPGILESLGLEGVTVEPLITTSTESMAIDTFRMQFQPDPEGILNDFVPSGRELTLAVRVNGILHTAFPDGDPSKPIPEPESAEADDSEAGDDSENTDDSEDGDDTENTEDSEDADEAEPAEEWLTESAEPANLIVVADADMLQDAVWARVSNFLGAIMISPIADNGDFVVNALDNLCGSNDLISLRSRGQYQRPFDKKIELEREADAKYREEETLLEAELRETERKLNELQSEGADSPGLLILTPEQQAEIANFREAQAETRKKLRKVKNDLRKDIESLGSSLKFANIGLIPILILLGGIVVVSTRARRRK